LTTILYNFTVISAKERETKYFYFYFYFYLFFMVKKVNLITNEIFVTPISLARVLSCIINRRIRNNPFSDLTSYGRIFLQINYGGGCWKVYPIKCQQEANLICNTQNLAYLIT